MSRATPRSLNRKQAGFSLIDVLLALGVVILISGITLTGIRRTNESNQAKAVGEQMKLVGGALNTYVSLRYDTLVAHVPGTDDVGDPGSAADPGPRTCVWLNSPANTSKMCTITSETLRRNGLLPNSFSGYNAFGSTYQYRVRIDTAGTSALVDGMVWTDEAYQMEGEERYDLIGQAMMVAGADSGMTRSTLTRVEGFNGAWSEENMGVSKLGVLAYRVGYNTYGYAAYLRLNGTGTGSMLGDIDMGSNNIYNVETLKAQNAAFDNIRLKQDTGAIVFSPAAAFNTTDNVAIPVRSDSDPRIETQGTGLAIRSDSVIRLTNSTDTSILADVQMDDLTAGDITASGPITGTSAAMSAGIAAQGSITSAASVRAPLVIGGPGGANNNTVMFGDANGGGIYFNSDAAGSTGSLGFKLTTATSTISMGSTNLETTGTIRTTTDLIADQRVTVGGNRIILDGVRAIPALGSACVVGDLGTITRSTVGDLAQCVANGGTYNWKSMGITPGSMSDVDTDMGGNATCAGGNPVAGVCACTGAGSTSGSPVTATCPAGSTLVSGGYRIVSGAPRAMPVSSYRTSQTTWVLYPGPTDVYTTGASVKTCWAVTAVCAK